MEAALRVVGEEIAGLDTRRNALLSQLAQVEAALAQAHAKRADLEESRNVFEEGVAFSMDALQHQACPSTFFLFFLHRDRAQRRYIIMFCMFHFNTSGQQHCLAHHQGCSRALLLSSTRNHGMALLD